MSQEESMELIEKTSDNLRIEPLSPENKERIYRISAGHPYIMKVLLGDFSRKKMKGNIERLIAGSDEILVALLKGLTLLYLHVHKEFFSHYHHGTQQFLG